jgi:hypothetical protein
VVSKGGTRLEVVAGIVLALIGLASALGAVAVVSAFDGENQAEHGFIYAPGLIIAALGALAVFYSVKRSRRLLWATTIVAILYSALIVFGAGLLPLLAATLLLAAVVSSAVRRRSASPAPSK